VIVPSKEAVMLIIFAVPLRVIYIVFHHKVCMYDYYYFDVALRPIMTGQPLTLLCHYTAPDQYTQNCLNIKGQCDNLGRQCDLTNCDKYDGGSGSAALMHDTDDDPTTASPHPHDDPTEPDSCESRCSKKCGGADLISAYQCVGGITQCTCRSKTDPEPNSSFSNNNLMYIAIPVGAFVVISLFAIIMRNRRSNNYVPTEGRYQTLA
jgi:hypothetical protein